MSFHGSDRNKRKEWSSSAAIDYYNHALQTYTFWCNRNLEDRCTCTRKKTSTGSNNWTPNWHDRLSSITFQKTFKIMCFVSNIYSVDRMRVLKLDFCLTVKLFIKIPVSLQTNDVKYRWLCATALRVTKHSFQTRIMANQLCSRRHYYLDIWAWTS